MTDRELLAGDPRARVPRGRLRAPLGTPIARTTSTSTASRRDPSCSEALGERIAASVDRGRARRGARSPGPELGAVALAAAASLAPRLPFLIVREARRRATAPQPARGRLRRGDQCVCLIEDVVTSGGAAVEAVEALREAGLDVPERGLRGRPRGGRHRRARASRRCGCGRSSALSELAAGLKSPAIPAWLSGSDARVTLRRVP